MALTSADYCVIVDALRGSLALDDKVGLFSYTAGARKVVLDKLWWTMNRQNVGSFDLDSSRDKEAPGGR